MATMLLIIAQMLAPAVGPALGPFEVRTTQTAPADATHGVFEAARPQLEACLIEAHARAPLAEAGTIVFIRSQKGATVQAAAILEPARGDLAACLRQALRALPLPATPARVRVTTAWTAPPPPKKRDYPYHLQ